MPLLCVHYTNNRLWCLEWVVIYFWAWEILKLNKRDFHDLLFLLFLWHLEWITHFGAFNFNLQNTLWSDSFILEWITYFWALLIFSDRIYSFGSEMITLLSLWFSSPVSTAAKMELVFSALSRVRMATAKACPTFFKIWVLIWQPFLSLLLNPQ